ncbi:unnamed protein product, partial [Ectocarpus sp. 12 AP-2014]
MHGKENRLSLSSTALPPAASVLGPSPDSSAAALCPRTANNKRQQMLKYSKSRRLSLKPGHKRGKSDDGASAGEAGSGGGSKATLLRKSLSDKG